MVDSENSTDDYKFPKVSFSAIIKNPELCAKMKLKIYIS